jgi:hypothetical protein
MLISLFKLKLGDQIDISCHTLQSKKDIYCKTGFLNVKVLCEEEKDYRHFDILGFPSETVSMRV